MLKFTLDPAKFQTQLMQTMAWYQYGGQSEDADSLRKLHDQLELSLDGRCLPFRYEELSTITNQLFALREKQLEDWQEKTSLPSTALFSEGLIGFTPATAFAMDGVMEIASEGFFDYCDFAPCDLWVYHSQGALLEGSHSEHPDKLDMDKHCIISWVPPTFRASVVIAMRTNADAHSTRWIANLNLEKGYFTLA